MKRNTTPEKLLDAINNKKLSVIGGKIYSVDMVRNYHQINLQKNQSSFVNQDALQR